MALLGCVSLCFSEVSCAICGLGSSSELTALEDLTGVIFHPAPWSLTLPCSSRMSLSAFSQEVLKNVSQTIGLACQKQEKK